MRVTIYKADGIPQRVPVERLNHIALSVYSNLPIVAPLLCAAYHEVKVAMVLSPNHTVYYTSGPVPTKALPELNRHLRRIGARPMLDWQREAVSFERVLIIEH